MLLNIVFLSVAVGIVYGENLYFEPKEFSIDLDRKVATEESYGKKPTFCNKLDCPDYSVVESGKGYELREYVSTSWVTTSLTGIDYNEASGTMFHKLFDYIRGKNEKKEKIAMTAPVLVRLIPGPGPACENNFTMSFFMSNKVQDPPMPADKTVSLERIPVFRAYVRQFSGYVMKEEQWINAARQLANDVKDTTKYHTEFFFTAGYNSPFQIFNRHNEIWFISK